MIRDLRNGKGSRGFALVVTLSLMILLTVIAVGLLSLSSIALRSSFRGMAMVEAQANARMALMLAIGELQKHAGPDKAVTATSGIRSATPEKPHLTGVWESWDYNPASTSLGYITEKKQRFRSWLVSSPNPADSGNPDFTTTAWKGKTIELVGDASLGGAATGNSNIVAGQVPVSTNGVVRGGYAWHVSDESVKARINLYRDPDINTTLARKCALLAGHRSDPSVMKGPAGSSLDFLPNDLTSESFGICKDTSGKVTDLDQVDLLPSPRNARGKIKPFRHDVTPHSLGLLTDARNGGLKQDLSCVFEMSDSPESIQLPGEFADKGLYESTHGITGVSDPKWSALSSYYNTFKAIENDNTNPTYVQAPAGDVKIDDMAPSDRFFAGPVIQKVEMLFSFVTRDEHPVGRLKKLRETYPDISYLGHLVFAPLITLHNPYNVSISFDQLQVSMVNVPVAFQFYRNGQPLSNEMLELAEFFNGASKNGVRFNIRIADWSSTDRSSSSTNGPIIMKPGQSLVCAPYIRPDAIMGDGGTSAREFFSYYNQLTSNIKAKPGFVGRCVGYDTDAIWPSKLSSGAALSSAAVPVTSPIMALASNDLVRVDFAVQKPSLFEEKGVDNFRVEANIILNGNSYPFSYGGLDFRYSDNNTLKGLFPETYTSDFKAGIAYVPNSEPISQHANAQTFAVFSAYARSTSGGVHDNGGRSPTPGSHLRDGRLAGMPYLFHNPARTVVSIDLTREKPGSQSHELNFQPFFNLGQVEDYFNLDALNRTACLTGNTTQRGIKSGSYLELPIGPMQTIADFRRSNALTSSYLPNYAQPVANSRISPLLSTDKVVMTDSKVADYELLDHSVLANHALYDRFYFSTFATDGDLTPDRVFESFMNGDAPLPSQAFQPHLSAGETVSSAKSKLFSGGKPTASAYQDAAAYQMVRGAFNVNSTSVQAWKARLASINKGDIATLWAKSAGLEIVKATGAPILPMSLVNGGGAGSDVDFSKIDDSRTNEWNGYRELTDAELETLAARIVDEVRERGPFLSLSEFVNRRIGPESELTRMGALEAAIANSKVNDNIFKDQVPVTEQDLRDKNTYPYNTLLASVGNPAAGAPGWVSQGDIMRLLEPAATVRADTFVIRVCGEANDANGNVTATAYAEALVQRLPEYIDPSDSPFMNASTDPGAAPANQRFGRRIRIVSFRWLAKSEI